MIDQSPFSTREARIGALEEVLRRRIVVLDGATGTMIQGDVQRHGARAYIEMELTETFAMVPAASVSGLYFAHAHSHYFCGGTDQSQSGRRLRPAQGDGRRRGGSMAGAEPRV